MSGSRDLTCDKAESWTCPGWGPDMSEKPLWNPVSKPDNFSWDLAAEELGLGRTCLTRVTRTRPGTRISPVRLGQPDDKERPGHVQAGGQTCPTKASGIRSDPGYV
jgi:hypothetical protein